MIHILDISCSTEQLAGQRNFTSGLVMGSWGPHQILGLANLSYMWRFGIVMRTGFYKCARRFYGDAHGFYIYARRCYGDAHQFLRMHGIVVSKPVNSPICCILTFFL